jgi:hypothetical protein
VNERSRPARRLPDNITALNIPDQADEQWEQLTLDAELAEDDGLTFGQWVESLTPRLEEAA